MVKGGLHSVRAMHIEHKIKIISPPPLWDDRLLLGHPDIDREHKSLFAIAARLFSQNQTSVSYHIIGAVLSELADYTSEHFGHEEILMDQAKYPGCDEHICHHLDFIQKLSVMVDAYERGRTDILPELQSFLFEWLLNHISEDDRKFGEFWRSKNPSVKNGACH